MLPFVNVVFEWPLTAIVASTWKNFRSFITRWLLLQIWHITAIWFFLQGGPFLNNIEYFFRIITFDTFTWFSRPWGLKKSFNFQSIIALESGINVELQFIQPKLVINWVCILKSIYSESVTKFEKKSSPIQIGLFFQIMWHTQKTSTLRGCYVYSRVYVYSEL